MGARLRWPGTSRPRQTHCTLSEATRPMVRGVPRQVVSMDPTAGTSSVLLRLSDGSEGFSGPTYQAASDEFFAGEDVNDGRG